MAPSLASLFSQHVVVGVGDMAVSDNPDVTLSTYALGSCVGLVAYEPQRQVGGLLHLMLPDSTISAEKAARQPAMFADTGLPLFFRELATFKILPGRVRLLMAGGANVILGRDPFRIGERNVQATAAYLGSHSHPLRHAAIGGSVNRTLHLELATGVVRIKTPSAEERIDLSA